MNGRGRGASAVAMACVVALLGSVVLIVALHRSRVAPPAPAAARFFANDTRWTIVRNGQDDPMAVQSQVGVPGIAVAEGLSPSIADAVRELAARPNVSGWSNTSTVVYANGQHVNIPEIYLASADGIVQPIGSAALPLPLRFEPAVQILPADPRPGATWDQQGSAFYDQLEVVSYRMDTEILRAEGDCLVVAVDAKLTLTELGRQLGGTDYTDRIETRYCPGRWAVGSTSGIGTMANVSAPEAEQARAGFEPPTGTGGEPSSESEAILYQRHSPFPGSADPLVLPDLDVAVDLDETSQVASGLVAGAPLIFPIWRLPGAGPVLAAPVRAGDHIVLGDTAGTVTALEPATGYVRWQRRFRSMPLRLAAGSDGSAVGLVDRAGRGVLLDAKTGATLAAADIDGPTGVAVAAGPTLIVAGAGGTAGVDATGRSTHASTVAATSGPVVVAGQVLVGTADGHVAVVDPDGASRRAYLGHPDAVVTLVGGAGQAAAATGHRVSILNADLTIRATLDDDAEAVTIAGPDDVEVRAPNPGARVTTTAGTGRIRVYDADGRLLRTLQAAVRTTGSIGDATQRAAAVTDGDVTWVATVAGLTRFAGTGS